MAEDTESTQMISAKLSTCSGLEESVVDVGSHHSHEDDTNSSLTSASSLPVSRPLLKQLSSYASFQLPQFEGRRKSPIFSYAITVLCFFMMFIEIMVNDWTFAPMSENPTLGPTSRVLLLLGAKRTDLILNGDWYRLFAPILLHAGVIHLVLNMFALASVGYPLEREHGSLRVAYIFLVSGFMGIVTSAIFIPTQVGIGASGAIFGLFGAAWSELVQNWSLYQGQAWKKFLQLLVATVLNLMLGLMPFLDNFAHVGGMFAGFFCGLSVLVSNRYSGNGIRKRKKTSQKALQLVSMVVTPASMVGMLLILYLGVPISDWCPWCKYINCVPIPGAWDCDPCSTAQFTAQPFVNGTVLLHCPDGASRYTNTSDPVNLSSEIALDLCRSTCL